MNETMNKLSPKTSFLVGIATGFLVICTVGFFVLLGVVLTGKDKAVQADTETPATVVKAEPTPAPTPTPTEPLPTAPIQIKGVQKDDHIYGDPNAQITVVEYSDTECPFCKQFHPTLKQVVDTYQGKVNWVYRSFPLAQLHSKATKEAEALECAEELGGNDGFWKFTNRLYEVTPSNDGLDAAQLPKIAKEVGLDEKKFQECYDSGKYAAEVQAQYNDGLAAGAQGTPYAVILAGDQKIPVPGAVPFAQLKATLDPLVK